MSQNTNPKLVVALTAFAALTMTTSAWGHGTALPPAFSERAAPAEQQEWGIAGDPREATREIVVRMSDDMRFSPNGINVRAGETVRFVIHNDGVILHEMVIGTPEKLIEHADLMQRFPGMAHDEPWMAHVAPGERAELMWTFNRAGRFDFACLLPGHFQAGMTGHVAVEHDPLAQHSIASESIR